MPSHPPVLAPKRARPSPRRMPSVTVSVAASDGLTLTNLHVACLAGDQPGGTLPQGIHIDYGAPVGTLNGGGRANLTFTMWGDNAAADSGTCLLRVTSDGAPNGLWGFGTLGYRLSLPSGLVFEWSGGEVPELVVDLLERLAQPR